MGNEMTLDKDEALLGLDIVGNSIRMVEAERQDGKLIFSNVAHATLDLPFDFYAIGNDDFIPRFASAINSLLDKAAIRARTTYFALERRMLLIKQFQMDLGLNDEDLHRQVEWELSQVLVSARDEYNVGCERLGPTSNMLESVVVAAVRKSIVLYLKEIFGQTPLKLAGIDVDLFAAIRALSNAEEDMPLGLAALVDPNERGIDFCLINQGKYLNSSEISNLRTDGDRMNFLTGSGEEIAKVVNDELIRLLENMGNSRIPKTITKVYLTGNRAESEVIPPLQKLQGDAEIVFADPFRNVEKRLSAESESLIKLHPEMFLASVGMVLS